MTRSTSIDAYYSVINSGALGKRQQQVYEYLFANGPLTAKQITCALKSSTDNSGTFTTRLSELKNAGLVHEVGVTECEHTKRHVLLWDVTKNDKIGDFKRPKARVFYIFKDASTGTLKVVENRDDVPMCEKDNVIVAAEKLSRKVSSNE